MYFQLLLNRFKVTQVLSNNLVAFSICTSEKYYVQFQQPSSPLSFYGGVGFELFSFNCFRSLSAGPMSISKHYHLGFRQPEDHFREA